MPGRVGLETGRMYLGGDDGAGAIDLLDKLFLLVLRKSGNVVVVPTERMPSRAGVAATHRY